MSGADLLSPETFTGLTVVLVIPVDPFQPWMAERTWQIARLAAARNRRVALIDLSLREPALDLNPAAPTPLGIVDVFARDVPISDAAQKDQVESLHFLAAGKPVEHPGEVWGHRRWGRLASGFENEHALLIAFVPPQALPVLNLSADGLILMRVGNPSAPADTSPGLQRMIDENVPVLASMTESTTLTPARPSATLPEKPPFGGRVRTTAHPGVAWAILAAAVIIAIGLWSLADRAPDPVFTGDPGVPVEGDTMYYALQVAAFGTLERAAERAEELDTDALTTTVTPVHRGPEIWYRVQIGMYPHSVAADSALRNLWDTGRVERPHGTILRTTHAFDLGGHETPELAFSAAQGLRRRGIPAYVLVARDGASVLFGAFEEPDQAMVAESLLVSAGLEPHLVPRLGISR